MNNLLFGILTIIISIMGYYFSWKYWSKNNYNIAILLLILSGLLLRIYTSTDFYLHEWDERYHALVAKSIVHHPLEPTLYENPILEYDYKSWTANHIWVHKQPFPLWIMGASMWLFGINVFALRLPSIILTSIGILLIFYIAKYFFNKKVGYLSALLFSINGLIIELTAGRTATDHYDVFYLFFIELAVFLSIVYIQKQKVIFNVLAGISLGIAILTKWLPALIVVPIWLLLIIDSGKFKPKIIVFQLIILLSISTIIFLPWQIYIFKAFPLEANWEHSYNIKHLSMVVEERSASIFYFFHRLRIDYGELIYLPLLWFLWKSFSNFKDKKLLALTIWFLIPLIFFTIAKTKMQAYILFTAPALFIITSKFWFMLYNYREGKKLKWLYTLILILLIALPARYTIERVKPFNITDRNPQWVSNLHKLNDKNIQNGIMFNYSRPIEAMFYTNLTVYPGIPEKKVIQKLIKDGYTVLINDNSKIPKEIRNISKIQFVELSK